MMIAALIIGSTSCKKDPVDDGDEKAPVVKTLTKSQLYDKEWHDKGSTILHEFKTGTFYNTDGSRKWLNNSDSMELLEAKVQSLIYGI